MSNHEAIDLSPSTRQSPQTRQRRIAEQTMSHEAIDLSPSTRQSPQTRSTPDRGANHDAIDLSPSTRKSPQTRQRGANHEAIDLSPSTRQSPQTRQRRIAEQTMRPSIYPCPPANHRKLVNPGANHEAMDLSPSSRQSSHTKGSKLSSTPERTTQNLNAGDKVRDDEICGWGGSTGVCRGDSGGSMVVVDHNKHYVIGLTSWGHADCKTDVPDVFVNIPTHVNWIKSITLKKEVKLDTLSDQCAYSAQILPRPRILLLGATGVGKSTLGNQLLGYYARSEEVPFVVGDSLTSQTSRISYKIGPWLGKGECFTVIDTPGTHDSEGRDYEHAVHMADIMKNEIGSVDVILILLSGQNLRFDQSVLELLKLYESIYSKNMWKHVMLETTFWSHDIRSVRSRKNRQNMNEEKRHVSVNQKLKQTFNLTFDVPTVFIDPVLPIFGDDYDQSIMEENEVEAFDEYTRQLWDFAMNKEPFHCAGNCQAPQGYFGGQPWVTPNKVAQREGKSTELTCRIWSGINQHAFNNITWTFNGNVVYVKKGNGDGSSVLFDPELNVTDTGADTHGNFAMSKLTIPTFSSKREGTYSCNNGLENDETNKAEVLLVVDAQWSEWGAWSSCSVHCMDEGSANPGSAHRTRTCTPPRNGGIKCREEDGQETTQCAGVVGQPLKFCPVDHRFTAWTGWGGCETGGCNDWRGKRKGHKYRTRVCVEARHGGVPCPKDPGATKQSARCSEDCGWRKWF